MQFLSNEFLDKSKLVDSMQNCRKRKSPEKSRIHFTSRAFSLLLRCAYLRLSGEKLKRLRWHHVEAQQLRDAREITVSRVECDVGIVAV